MMPIALQLIVHSKTRLHFLTSIGPAGRLYIAKPMVGLQSRRQPTCVNLQVMPLAVKLQTPCTATIYNISISFWGDAHIYIFSWLIPGRHGTGLKSQHDGWIKSTSGYGRIGKTMLQDGLFTPVLHLLLALFAPRPFGAGASSSRRGIDIENLERLFLGSSLRAFICVINPSIQI